jgi:hypothetical protein
MSFMLAGRIGNWNGGELDQVGSMTTIPESLSQNSGLSLGEGGALKAVWEDEIMSTKPRMNRTIFMRPQ